MFRNAKRSGSLAPLFVALALQIVPLALWVLPLRLEPQAPAAVSALLCARTRP